MKPFIAVALVGALASAASLGFDDHVDYDRVTDILHYKAKDAAEEKKKYLHFDRTTNGYNEQSKKHHRSKSADRSKKDYH